MLATFCLRLACGLVAVLPLLPAQQVPHRFFRVQFLTALGLLAVAGFFLYLPGEVGALFWLTLGVGMTCCFVGSLVWHLDAAPGGYVLNWITPFALAGCLLAGTMAQGQQTLWRSADDLASAALLGSATTAMLMGHSYLIAPAMSLAPLYRLLGALAGALLLRVLLACVGLWLWTSRPEAVNLETEMLLWLPVRWALGLLGPMFLGWMAWETARIRSTQSATGILYVVVIVCFLGELTSQLLLAKTGWLL
jgi:hypothetical protein